MASDEDAAKTFQELCNEASARYFSMMQERHIAGEEKYGPLKFVQANTLKEAMEEVADLGNYAHYTFMKLFILNEQIDKITDDQPILLGAQSFIPNQK